MRGFAIAGAVRFLAVDAREVAEATRRAHGLGPGAARIAADGVVATALLSAYIKGDERMTLQFQGRRPAVAFMGEVDAEGNVRARLAPADAAPLPDGRLVGILLAMKSDGPREVYRGQTAVEGQTFEEALWSHFDASEQVDVLLRIESAVAGSGEIDRAIGLMVERMPAHAELPSLEPDEFRARFAAIGTLPVDQVFASVAAGSLAGEPSEILEKRDLRWRCRCSMDKVEGMLAALDLGQLREMRVEDGGAEVTCHFCNAVYRVTADRLDAILAAREAGDTVH